MKKIFSILLTTLILGATAFAQVDRSKQPKAGPSPSLNFGEYKIYELKNGLKVIVVQNDKLPRVTMNLVIDRDRIFEGDKAGYVSLAGEMLRQGTLNRVKSDLDEEIDFMGANIGTSSSNVFASGLSKYSEKLMEILADVARNPSFPQAEFDKLKTQTISGIESNKDSPDAVASTVFNKVLYGANHPYGEDATVATAESVELNDCINYYKKYWMPNSAYLAIVGDIKPKTAKKLAKKYFGDWQPGTRPTNTFDTPQVPTTIEIAFSNKESAVQSVISLGNTIDLKPGDPDNIKLNLTNQILGVGSLGRLFQNIREDKGYTYGAYSDYDSDKLVGEFTASASVRNEVTDSAIVEFLNEFNRIRTEPVSDEELEGAKNFIIGSFGRSLESPQTIASFALNIERYGLPKDYYENYLNELGKLTKEDVMATAQKYIRPQNMVLTVVGKASDVADKLEKFGSIQYYDDEGNKTEKPSIPVPEGVTAQMVIDNYVKAIGGAENIKKIKDLVIKMEGEAVGMPFKLQATTMMKGGNKINLTIEADGLGVVSQQIYDGSKGRMSAGPNSKDLEGQDLVDLSRQAYFDLELRYEELGYKLALSRMAMVNGEKAYVIELTDPEGNKSSDFYSEASGLKIKSESVSEGPQGPSTSTQMYSDYRDVNGVKYPYVLNIVDGPQKLNFTVSEILMNKGIANSEFAIK